MYYGNNNNNNNGTWNGNNGNNNNNKFGQGNNNNAFGNNFRNNNPQQNNPYGYGQPIYPPQYFNSQGKIVVPTFQTEANRERDNTYREILKVLFNTHLNNIRQQTSGGSFNRDRNVNTVPDVARYVLRCNDLSLTIEVALDLRYRSLSFYVYPSDFDKRGDFKQLINQQYFRENPTVAALISSFARKLAVADSTYAVPNADGAAIAEDIFTTMMEDVSNYVNELSDWIVKNTQIRNRQIMFSNPLMTSVLRRGFQVGGFIIMPIFGTNQRTGQPMLTFNYSLDETMTNSLKQDQQYFNEKDEDDK